VPNLGQNWNGPILCGVQSKLEPSIPCGREFFVMLVHYKPVLVLVNPPLILVIPILISKDACAEATDPLANLQ